MTIGQISNAKFPPKIHIQSGPAASKPSASSKIIGCLYHATDAFPNGSTPDDLKLGKLQVCKLNSKGVAAWATVDAPDWCGVTRLVNGTIELSSALPGGNPIDTTQLRARSIVKYWRGAIGGTPGILSATIDPNTKVTLFSAKPAAGGVQNADTSDIYVEITY